MSEASVSPFSLAGAPSVSTAALQEIQTRGFAVFENAYSKDEVRQLRASIERRYEELGRPVTYARPPLEPAPDVEISVVGLVLYKLGVHCPEVAPLLVKPEIVETLRALLGTDMHLEFTSAVVCRGDRPFFKWHMHVGGVDNVVYRKQRLFPSFERSERATVLVYLDDVNEESGTLLIRPRSIREPTEPPQDPEAMNWSGQVELSCGAGTAVVMEQCTWHAARPKRSPGLRSYLAYYFTSSYAKKTSWKDESLRPFAPHGSLLASVLPRKDPE